MAPEAAVSEAPETVEAPAAASPPAKPAAKAPASGKTKKEGKKKGKEGAAAEPSATDGPSIAAHPRAARAVARAKSWGGLIGFLLGGYLSLPTGTLAEAGARALLSGIVGYVAVWAGAVFVWRRLVILEVKAREQQLLVGSQPPVAEPAGGGGQARGAR